MGVVDAVGWSPLLTAACVANSITTRLRLAAFLPNVTVESANLSTLVENLNYSADALVNRWPSHFTDDEADLYGRTDEHPADQRQIAEHAYGGRMGNGPVGSGDGWLYRGRGCIQLTGKANYMALAKVAGIPLEQLPALLETRAGAANSAAAFWRGAGCNALADGGDIVRVGRAVNGGTIGLLAVQALYAKALALIPNV